MATVNPPVRYQEDDNYEIELSRVREKIRTQFGDLTDRLKCRERELLEELDTVLASYRSYRDEFEIVRGKVRDLEMMKQRNEEELAASRSKNLQENIIKQIEEEIKSITYPKQPQLVSFVCESNILPEIGKLGKLVHPTVPRPGYYLIQHQYNQQPMGDTMDNIPQYAYPNITPNILPQQQQQQYYQSNSNKFPFDAILFYDDNKPYYEFTNFARIGFSLDGDYWLTSEHYFQAQKFEGFPKIQKEIRGLPGARDAFEFVRKPGIKSLVRKDWAEKKEEIMYKALKAKFSQNNDVRDKLLQTYDRMLVEDSPYAYWGIGSDKNGKNRLGELLMKLRTELRNTPTTSSPYTPSTTTQTKMKRSSSLSRLTIPFSLTTIDDKIIYDVNDSTNFLSNCYRANFKLEGKEWPTVLHYFVAKKFDLKRHHVSKILSLKNCEEVHLYSRNLKFQSDIIICWDMDKMAVMKQGLKAKFDQNSVPKQKLLNTVGSEIIERSTEDQYWSQLANGTGNNVMGELLCQVRDELKMNTRPSTPPNLSRWKTFENTASKMFSTVLPSSSKETQNPIHYTDFVTTGVYHDFSTYSNHGFTLDREYWKSVQHYFQAQKFPSAKWLMDDIKSAVTSKYANTIGIDKVNKSKIVKNWDSIREEVMLKALKAKFRDHSSLKETLLATGDRMIVNDSENEFWGCGKDGKGNNKLGKILMKVRSECLKSIGPSLQPNHTNSSSSLKIIPSNDDVIEFYDKDIPLSSTNSKYYPRNISRTNSYPCSSEDDNTTQLRIVRQVSYGDKPISFPPKNEGKYN